MQDSALRLVLLALAALASAHLCGVPFFVRKWGTQTYRDLLPVSVSAVLGVFSGLTPSPFWFAVGLAVVIGYGTNLGWFRTTLERRPLVAGLVVMTGVVAGLSGPAGGAGAFQAFLSHEMHLSPEAVQSVVYFCRKSVHVTAYGTLCVAAAGLAGLFWQARNRVNLVALWWVLVTASSDEGRQFFTPGRTGQWQDVLIDLGGAAAALTLLALRRHSKEDRGTSHS